MTVNYTSLLGLALPVTGTEAGAWGDVVNNYLTSYLDASVAGTQTITGSQTAVTLAVTNGATLVTVGSGATGSAQFQIITCTGNPASLLTITAPASSRQYIIINSTSTSQSVQIVGAGPTTGVTIVSGEKAHVAWNGSDFVKIATQSGNGSFVDLTVSGNLTLSGGTQNGVLYLNASRVATSGSALTFDGTNFANTLSANSSAGLRVTNSNAGSSTSANTAYSNGSEIHEFGILGTAYGGYGVLAAREAYIYASTTRNISLASDGGNIKFGAGAGAPERARIDTSGTLILRQSSNSANTSVSLNTTIQNALTLEADGDLLVGTTTNTNSSKLVASGTISETVSSTQYLVASQFDIGTAANEIPLNQYLGNLAYQDAGSIAGQVGLSAGTAALPSLVSATDTDTGMWFPAANTLAWSTGGTERARFTSTGGFETKPAATGHAVFNEDGVDADFRVESDNNQYMLWVDASADGVNIGGFDTIQGQLNVIKNTGDLVASTTALYITTGQTYGSAANKKNLDLVFQGYRDGAGTGGGAKARLRAIEQTADSRVGSLLIDVLDSAGDLQNALELTSSNVVVNQGGIDMDFRVESDTQTHILFVDAGTSRIGINNAAPVYKLHISGANGDQLAIDNAGERFTQQYWQNNGVPKGAIWVDNTDGEFEFYAYSGVGATIHTNATERVNFKSTGEVVFNDIGNDYDFRVESDTDTHCLFVDASANNVGIGTNSPWTKLSVYGSGDQRIAVTSLTGGSTQVGINLNPSMTASEAATNPAQASIYAVDSNYSANIIFANKATGAISNALTERARITSGGYFKASFDGSYIDATGTYHEFTGTTANGYTLRVRCINATPANHYISDFRFTAASPNNATALFIECRDSTAARFELRSDGGLANYQANDVNLSDQRVKKDIVAAPSYWDKIKGIEIVHFKYKDQTHDDNNVGVIAQQVEQVAPEFVDQNGWGDTPEDGVPLKSIYTSDMYHAAIKALQEAMARIEKLEAEVAALKGA